MNWEHELKAFFEAIAASKDYPEAFRNVHCTVQFRIADRVKDQPLDWHDGTSDGDWYYVQIDDGQVTSGTGNVRPQRDWHYCPLVEIERDCLKAVLAGTVKPLDLVFDGRLHITNWGPGYGISARWLMPILRLGQVIRLNQTWLSSGYHKAFLRG